MRIIRLRVSTNHLKWLSTGIPADDHVFSPSILCLQSLPEEVYPKIETERIIMKYICDTCGWVYDSELGAPKHKIPAGTLPEEISKYSGCPICGADWDSFTKQDAPKSVVTAPKPGASVWSAMKYQDKTESDR